MPGSENLRICITCGTQFDIPITEPLEECRMCLDPRQFVPPTGHAFTTLTLMRPTYTNQILQDPLDKHMWSIWTEPAFAIGQRAIFLQTPAGNVLWDCVANLDRETVDFVRSKGGVQAMVVSHPHFWTSCLDWAGEFGCPVFLSGEEREWACREDLEGRVRWIEGVSEVVLPGVTAVKLGGHFPGSLVLHWDGRLFTADTIAITLSGLYRSKRPAGANSFSFMWAYPNFIPLSPSVLHTMWQRLKPYEFQAVHSLFVGRDIRDARVKGEVLDGMKMQARFEGYEEHAILREEWDGSGVGVGEVSPVQLAGVPQARRHVQLERGF